jgi:hypothetical protein
MTSQTENDVTNRFVDRYFLIDHENRFGRFHFPRNKRMNKTKVLTGSLSCPSNAIRIKFSSAAILTMQLIKPYEVSRFIDVRVGVIAFAKTFINKFFWSESHCSHVQAKSYFSVNRLHGTGT